jgi:hypothetical protein
MDKQNLQNVTQKTKCRICRGSFFVFSELRWNVIVRFIYIGEIVDLHILNFLFMNCNFKQYLTPYVSALLRLSILYTEIFIFCEFNISNARFATRIRHVNYAAILTIFSVVYYNCNNGRHNAVLYCVQNGEPKKSGHIRS